MPDALDAGDERSPWCVGPMSLSGREASVPVDVIWLASGRGYQLEEFREAMQRHWDIMREGRVDVSEILIGERPSAIPGPRGGFAGRAVFISTYATVWRPQDPGVALLSNHRYYESRLRPDSERHVIVVSQGDTLMDADRLHEVLVEQLGPDVKLHAVVSEVRTPTPDNPSDACPGAWSAGVNFLEVAARTGGATQSICADDWSAVVDAVTVPVAVRTPIPCAFSLPIVRPPGLRYSTESVMLRMGDDQWLRPVRDEAACAEGDWWLFEPSARVHLCPHRCDAAPESLTVEFACPF